MTKFHSRARCIALFALLAAIAPKGRGQDPTLARALWGDAAQSAEAISELRGRDWTPESFRAAEALIRAGRAHAPVEGDRQSFDLTVGSGVTLTVNVQLPPDYDPAKAYPLMLTIGGGPVGSEQAAVRGSARMAGIWSEPAREAGWFVASVVDRVSISQNRSPLRYHVLHADHARAIFDAMIERFHIDPNRLHSTGVSLGSNYSLAYAEAHPDWLAGVVPVSTEGESREWALRNLANVGVYVLEGVNDRNIKAIEGPRKMDQILSSFGYPHVYEEDAESGHESFTDRYPDVLNWLAERPRDPFPKRIVRVAHPGIIMPGKRFYWIEGDTRQAIFEARAEGNTIRVDAARARKLTFHLSDRLVDLDRPITIEVNGEVAFEGRVVRSIVTAIEDTRTLNDTERFATARVTVDVPHLDRGETWVNTLAPKVEEGTLAFWEGYAMDTLREERPDFPAELELIESAASATGVAARVTAAPAGSPLQEGDLVLEFDGEPFFAGADSLAFLESYLIRSGIGELTLKLRRGGEERTVTLDLSH